MTVSVHKRRLLTIAALGLSAMMTTAACTNSATGAEVTPSVTDSAAASTASPSSTAAGRAVTVNTNLVSGASDLHRVGPDNSQVFGWNLLVGTGKFLNEDVEIRLQGSVDYVNGSGAFGGFMRLVATDGSEVAMNLEGTAVRATASEGADPNALLPTDLKGTLTFIGASGRYANLEVNGDYLATRGGEVGAPVTSTMNLRVRGQVTSSPAASASASAP